MASGPAGAAPAVRSAFGLPAPRAQALAFLNEGAEPLPAPLRGVLYGLEGFRQHARALAQAQPIERRRRWRRRRTPPFMPRLDDNLAALRRTAAYLQALAEDGQERAQAVTLLSEPLQRLQRRWPTLRAQVGSRTFARLPYLRATALAGMPRIYAIAWSFVTHTDANLDANLLLQCLLAYQEVEELRVGELRALPLTLQMVLLEDIARLMEGIASRQAAAEWADALLEGEDEPAPAALQALLAAARRRGVAPSLLARLAQRLDAEPIESQPVLRAWAAAQAAEAQGLDALVAQAQAEDAADEVSLRQAMASLEAVDRLDWSTLVEPASTVLMRLSQSEAFRRDHPLTREQCLVAVARLARRLRRPESEVAQRALDLAEADESSRALGPAPFLIGPQVGALSSALGPGRRPAPLSMRQRCLLYIGGLVAGTLALVFSALSGEALVPWAELLSVALLAVPASEVVLVLLQRLLAEFAPPQPLPRLALAQGLGPAQRTLVVLPCVLRSSQQVASLAQRLEQHWLAQREAHVQFALLSDWADAPQRQAAGDALLLDAARTAVAVLNARHPRGAHDDREPRFLLLHRERSWSATERAWIGWDRGRGQREQLLAHLAGTTPSPFLPLGEDSRLAPSIVHLLTLEADTVLPPGALRTLVSIAAHPLNAPQLDRQTRRVTRGYGVLQPQLAPALPGVGAPVRADDPPSHGLAPADDVHQRLFHEARFLGEGLIQVDAFHRATAGRVPEDRLPEAALYEGLWARCAQVEDVTLLHVPAAGERARVQLQRRARQAWLLLPLWVQAVHGRVGLVNLWKLLDGVRRSLLAPVSVALLWWSFTLHAVPPQRALGLVIAAYALRPLLDALRALMPRRSGTPVTALLEAAIHRLGGAARTAVVQFTRLMPRALAELESIARSLWRLAVTRAHLLEPLAPRRAAPEFAHVDPRLVRHAPTVAASLMFVLLGLVQPGAAWAWLVGVGGWWMLAPVAGWGLAHLRQRRGASALDTEDARLPLQQLAQDSWRCFSLPAWPAGHRLPPAQAQPATARPVPLHTTPAAIGLSLLAAACAQRLGLIGTRELIERLEPALQALQRVPRHHGHPHAAIDTQTLRVLPPGRIDTHDSGVLAACLWAVAQACREAAAGPAPHAAREAALSAALRRLRHDGDPQLRDALRDPALQALLQEDPWALWRREPGRLRALLAAAQAARDGRPRTPGAVDDLLTQLDSLLQDREDDRDRWPGRLRSLATQLDAYVEAMDFGLLYEPHRRLLRTGHRVDEAMPEEALHDALGTGARLASFVGIAKGDLPGEHWSALDRTLARMGDRVVLQAMTLEPPAAALLPAVLLDEPALGLLRHSVRTLVGAVDAGLAGSGGWHPPSAAVLSLVADPEGARERLQRLQRQGLRGTWGFASVQQPVSTGGPGTASAPAGPSPAANDEPLDIAALAADLAALADALADHAPRRWFSAVPAVRAHLALLQERVPDEGLWPPPALAATLPSPIAAPAPARSAPVIDPSLRPPAALPSAWMGNGRLQLTLRPQGGSALRWNGLVLDRHDGDLLRDEGGALMLLRQGDEVEFHSLTRAPHPRPDAFYRTRLLEDRVEYEAECDFWRSRLTVWLAPDEDVEFRQLSLQNLEAEPVAFELLSVLPLFGDLSPAALRSVRAEAPDGRTLLFGRSGAPGAAPVWLAHFVARCDVEPASLRLLADRTRLWPRRGDATQLRPGPGQHPLPGGALDTGFDPAAAIALRVVVPADSRVCITFATAVGEDRDRLLALADEYRRDVHLQRTRRMAAAVLRQQQARDPAVQADELLAMQSLFTAVVAGHGRPRPAVPALLDLEALRRHGIDAQRPLVLVRLTERRGLRSLHAVRRACRRWAAAGRPVSLVVVDAQPPEDGRRWPVPLPPLSPLSPPPTTAGRPAPPVTAEPLHRFVAAELGPVELATLQALAVVDLVADSRPLAQQVDAALADATPASRALAQLAAGPGEALPPPDRRTRSGLVDAPLPDLAAPWQWIDGGLGLRLLVDSQRVPPRAWQQRLGHREFGCAVSECGGGWTWADAGARVPLTRPSQDLWRDPAGEHYLVQDLQTLQWWSLLPSLDRNGLQGVEVTHRPGASRYVHRRGELCVEVDVAVHPAERAKVMHVRLRNEGGRPRPLRAFALAEWHLAATPAGRATRITEFAPALQAALAQAPLEPAGGAAFLMLAGLPAHQWSCARQECFDALGRLRPPRTLAGAQGSGHDPCAAIDATLVIPPGGQVSFAWVLGHGDDRAQALARAARLRQLDDLRDVAALAVQAARAAARGLKVRTPDAHFDALVNHWLPWQAWLDEQGVLSGAPASPQHAGAPPLQQPVPESCALLAAAAAGQAERAWEHFLAVSPAHQAQRSWRRYRGEPFALAADIVRSGEHAGQAGSPWGGDGAAGALLQAATQGVLGLHLQDDRLRLQPNLPPHWPHARIELRWGDRRLLLHLRRDEAPPQAAVLPPGTWLHRAQLPPSSEWTVPLPRPADTAGTQDADSAVEA